MQLLNSLHRNSIGWLMTSYVFQTTRPSSESQNALLDADANIGGMEVGNARVGDASACEMHPGFVGFGTTCDDHRHICCLGMR